MSNSLRRVLISINAIRFGAWETVNDVKGHSPQDTVDKVVLSGKTRAVSDGFSITITVSNNAFALKSRSVRERPETLKKFKRVRDDKSASFTGERTPEALLNPRTSCSNPVNHFKPSRESAWG